MHQSIRVKNTEAYKDPDGEKIVCRGKLILVNTNEVTQLGFRNLIIISEKEEIEAGDFIAHSEYGIGKSVHLKGTSGAYWVCKFNGINETVIPFKILALPNQFSSETLQEIVDEIYKDGDEVFIECEDVGGEEWQGDTVSGEPFWNSIYGTKITKEHITIYGCGKFNEEQLHLDKTEASLLLIELHNFLNQ